MTTPLTAGAIALQLERLPGWEHRDGALHRRYTTNGWPNTMLVVNAIAYVAEAGGHHPDLSVSWAKVDVALWTHSAGGITALDFETAALIDRAVLWRPGPDDALSGPPTPLAS
jgi:4a-hydroxytetrahydrobiopterin dehydratase